MSVHTGVQVQSLSGQSVSIRPLQWPLLSAHGIETVHLKITDSKHTCTVRTRTHKGKNISLITERAFVKIEVSTFFLFFFWCCVIGSLSRCGGGEQALQRLPSLPIDLSSAHRVKVEGMRERPERQPLFFMAARWSLPRIVPCFLRLFFI